MLLEEWNQYMHPYFRINLTRPNINNTNAVDIIKELEQYGIGK